MAAYTMKDVRRLGIAEVVQRAIEHVSPKYVQLHSSKIHCYTHKLNSYRQLTVSGLDVVQSVPCVCLYVCLESVYSLDKWIKWHVHFISTL